MDKYLSETVEIFKALGDYTRLKILKLLQSKGTLCVGMLSQEIGISQPAVSQHLKVLKTAGLIEGEKNGYHMHYKVQLEKFTDINLKDILSRIRIESKSGEKCELAGEEQKCREINA